MTEHQVARMLASDIGSDTRQIVNIQEYIRHYFVATSEWDLVEFRNAENFLALALEHAKYTEESLNKARAALLRVMDRQEVN